MDMPFPLPVTWFAALVAYILIWWTMLFAILPLGVRTAQDAINDGEKTDALGRQVPSAPLSFNLRKVVIMNSLVSAAAWLVYLFAAANDYFGLYEFLRGPE